MTHTPGPWHIAKSGNIQSQHGITVAVPYGPAGKFVDVEPEHQANAHLIASAPELLMALEALAPMFGRPGVAEDYGDEILKAEAAIAKAKGETV